jgi:hypothetical protein
MIHNESVNIWSHLGGAILFVMLIGYTALGISHLALVTSSYDSMMSSFNKYTHSHFDNEQFVPHFSEFMHNVITEQAPDMDLS